jgi:hypothetical protein
MPTSPAKSLVFRLGVFVFVFFPLPANQHVLRTLLHLVVIVKDDAKQVSCLLNVLFIEARIRRPGDGV